MTRARLSVLLASALLATSLSALTDDARACAVLTPDQSVPVTGHKMILSLSKDNTTLWDQFAFTGDPASFGWILPIKGQVEVDVSSDALFDAFAQVTAPQIYAPDVCPNSCKGQGGNDGGGGVDVISHEAVGPYDTVQLASNDPNALKDWLQMHSFPVPAAVQPVFDTYVAEGFGFLAIRLLPGMTTEAVQPVRVTMPGAAPSVPIRLLAAGTGDLTQVTLWVVSDGKYLPTNAPVTTLAASDLVWDFAKDSSDYEAVRAEKLAASGGLAYLVEQASQRATFEFISPLQELVMSDPAKSGYGKDAAAAQESLDADMAAMFGKLGDSPWVTRLSADLSRQALKSDLTLGAAADQSSVPGNFTPGKHINAAECPPDPCATGGSSAGGSDSGGAGGSNSGGSASGGNNTGGSNSGSGSSGGGDGNGDDAKGGGCGVTGSPAGDGTALGLVLALGLALRRRRAAR